MARDEAKPSQIKILVQRSGGKCAYPECGKELSLPSKSANDSPKAIGKVAHICAASPDGPRYDASMTPAQRGSAENLIYICNDHHEVVDNQLEFHTVKFLVSAKNEHEERVARAVSYAMGQVGFEQLELVCKFLMVAASGNGSQAAEFVMPIDIDEKIEINDLGEVSRHRITIGLAKRDEVQRFVQMVNSTEPRFADKLVSTFKAIYYKGKADGFCGDELFDYVCSEATRNAGPVYSDILDAACLAVVAHLFHLCEIFEHEHPAA